MITKKLKKKAVNYYCKSCDYNTSDKNDFKRHKLTRKHLKMENGNKKTGSVISGNLVLFVNIIDRYSFLLY